MNTMEPDAKKPKVDTSAMEDDELREKAKQLLNITDAMVEKYDLDVLRSLIIQREKTLAQIEELKNQYLNHPFYKASLERLIENPPVMKLVITGKASSDTKTRHSKANTTTTKMDLENIEKDLYTGRVSNLLVKLNADTYDTNTELSSNYHARSGVSSLIICAIKDAMKLTNTKTGTKLKVLHESSLFSDCNDHLVVAYSENNYPIIAVEDQKPYLFQEGKGLPKSVKGQVYDYLMEMRFLGRSLPLVVLSTFQESFLFWQDDNLNMLITSKEERSQIIRDALASKRAEDTSTPSSLQDEGLLDIQQSIFTPEYDRHNMFVSQKFESTELVKLLYTAILIGWAVSSRSPQKELIAKRSRCDCVALKLDETSYEWGHLRLARSNNDKILTRSRSMQTRTRKESANDNTYFLIERIGRGSTSKVFHSVDCCGNRCAIKMLFERHDNWRHLSSESEFQDNGKAACTREIARLTKFYSFLRGKVIYKQLNGFPCVVMPFFRPLKKEDRLGALKEIKSKLKRFLPLKYKDCDVCWRHVGKFLHDSGEEEIVLFDLADLEEVNRDEQNFQQAVADQMEMFEEGISEMLLDDEQAS